MTFEEQLKALTAPNNGFGQALGVLGAQLLKAGGKTTKIENTNIGPSLLAFQQSLQQNRQQNSARQLAGLKLGLEKQRTDAAVSTSLRPLGAKMVDLINKSTAPIDLGNGKIVKPGERFRIDENNPINRRLIQSNGIVKAPTREETSGPGGFSAGTKSQAGEATSSALDAGQLISRTSNLLRRLNKLGPGVVGLRGAGGEFIGGLAGQISSDLGNAVTKGITGVSPEKLQTFRSNAKALVQASIRPVIAEEGKVTDSERSVVARIQKVDTLSASFPQVQAALKASTILQSITRDKSTFRAKGSFATPLVKNDGSILNRQMESMGNQLVKQGFTREEAVDGLRAIVESQREMLVPGFFNE